MGGGRPEIAVQLPTRMCWSTVAGLTRHSAVPHPRHLPAAPHPTPTPATGVGGYYRGIGTKLVQSVLAAALLFVAKEKITDVTRDVLLAPLRGRGQGQLPAKAQAEGRAGGRKRGA